MATQPTSSSQPPVAKPTLPSTTPVQAAPPPAPQATQSPALTGNVKASASSPMATTSTTQQPIPIQQPSPQVKDDAIATAALAVSVIGLLLSLGFNVWNYYLRGQSLQYQKEALSHQDKAYKQTRASLVSTTRTAIATAHARAQDAGGRIVEYLGGREYDQLKKKEKEHVDRLKALFASANESYLNQLEDACQHYKADNVEREDFKARFCDEVRRVCESKNETFKKALIPKENSKYACIWHAYDEWVMNERKGGA